MSSQRLHGTTVVRSIPGLLLGLLLAGCGGGGETAAAVPQAASAGASAPQPPLSSRHAPVIEQEGHRFRDLNRNGALDPYEDWRLEAAERARDLVARMTLAEKAGTMLHGSLVNDEVSYDFEQARVSIEERKVNSLITRLGSTPVAMAEQNNDIQEIAEQTRLGIPVTISTDPRHHFQFTLGATVTAAGYSQWPELIGFAALHDADRVREFADIARREYRAVGIHMGLSPQADLSTEPRWPRINGTFGEDAELAGELVQAYVEGFQNGAAGLGADSVAMVVKHWVGYGAAEHGYDSHNYYGRYAVFPGDNFDYHVLPFLGAFESGVSGVMPTYSILKDLVIDGQPVEQTGAGFSRFLLTDQLRGKYGFDGVILSDWAITRDCPEVCIKGEHEGETQTFATLSTAWGVLDKTMTERFALGIEAGIDQFGGTEEMQAIVEAVQQNLVTEARVDASVLRVMTQKLELGLFENPYVDVGHAASFVGNDGLQALADSAQRQSLVLLENRDAILPLTPNGQRVWLHGIEAEAVRQAGFEVAAALEEADLAFIRAETPFEILHPNYVFGAMQHEGNLAFEDGNEDYQAIRQAAAVVPTIVTVYMDRPAVLTNIRDKAQGLIANFGISDQALLEVLTGKDAPLGRLPFQLPANMASVEAQFSDVPFDANELYPFGYGLNY